MSPVLPPFIMCYSLAVTPSVPREEQLPDRETKSSGPLTSFSSHLLSELLSNRAFLIVVRNHQAWLRTLGDFVERQKHMATAHEQTKRGGWVA